MSLKSPIPPSEPPGESAALSRRTFLMAAGGVTAMLAIGAAARTLRRRGFLRPPGGQDEASFMARCIKCDRCRSACPTSVIGVVPAEESLLAARTPVMKFHLGYCSFCNQCVEVCPTRALEPFDIRSVKIGLAVVTDRCLALHSGGCTVCGNECPYQAITFDDQQHPIVDPDACNGCGICEKVCPALVLRTYIGGTLRGIEIRPIPGKGAHAAGARLPQGAAL